MNNFEAQYIILSSKYLQEKLDLVKSRSRLKKDTQKEDSSKLQKIVRNIFK
jgi:hypothetical protein